MGSFSVAHFPLLNKVYWNLMADPIICIYTRVYRMYLVAQLCPTLCDSMDCCLPGSPVHRDSPGKNIGVGCHALLQGVFPTQGSNPGLPHCTQILYCLSHHGSPRILEWVAYPFSRGSSQPRIQTRVSALWVYSVPAELPGKPIYRIEVSIPNERVKIHMCLHFGILCLLKFGRILIFFHFSSLD